MAEVGTKTRIWYYAVKVDKEGFIRNLGGILVLTLFMVAVAASFAAVYYFTEIETQKSELLELQVEVKELRRQVRDGEQPAQSEAPSSVPVRLQGRTSASGRMIIGEPADGQTVGSPVTVSGRAIAFESTVNIRVKDSAGNVLTEIISIADAPDAGRFGEFSVDTSFSVPATASGTIEVFEYSARDGLEINKADVPVSFAAE